MLRKLIYAAALLMAISCLITVAPRAVTSAASAKQGIATTSVVAAGPEKTHPLVSTREPVFSMKKGHLVEVAGDVLAWSGNVVNACSTCEIRYINANFKVPAISCANSVMGPQGANLGIWVGLDGDVTLEQDGIEAFCTSHTSAASYAAFYEMVPGPPVTISRTVKAGDSIAISVYYDQSNHVYDMTFNDSSEGQSVYTKNGLTCPSGYTCRNAQAEDIVENVGSGVPTQDLADFGSVSFSGTTVTSLDGTHGDLCAGPLWSASAVEMEDPNYLVMAYSGAITTCSGPDGFIDYFLQSN